MQRRKEEGRKEEKGASTVIKENPNFRKNNF
jgi:hypothetical protein